ncbi:MAG: DUF1080 domain-containing protein [Planctomycetaceae bacterium]|nr:DUF1080 domain-containing protein [Planctomycetaceae bacterium]
MMKKIAFVCCLLLVVACSASVFAQTVTKPFNGKNLDGWKKVRPEENFLWRVGAATLASENSREFSFVPLEDPDKIAYLVSLAGGDWGKNGLFRGGDLCTEKTFGDCTVEVEFVMAKGSNSGVYLMGEYEVQVADGWGKTGPMSQGDIGAIYSAAAPEVNAAKAPGQWQKFIIEFQAPKFDANGNKTVNAKFLKITLNGKVVQENVEVKGSTGGGVTGHEVAKGPLMLQGNHGPVAFRNIVITEK